MKTFVLGIMASNPVWPIILLFARFAGSIPSVEKVFQRVLYERILRQRVWIETFIQENIPKLSVTSGPFSGMKYPQLESAGSMLAPKLLGTYESEIAHVFQASKLARYDTVIDVGCAEGFYAVGIARSNPHCVVHAFDISVEAQNLCLGLAEANEVSDRVRMGGLCGDADLKEAMGKRTLIVSDCEGAEMDLFSESVAGDLASADLMIEVHEHLGANLSVLQQRFEATHQCEVVRCVMDAERLQIYHHPLVDDLPDRWRVVLFAECRTRANCWLIAHSRSTLSQNGHTSGLTAEQHTEDFGD